MKRLILLAAVVVVALIGIGIANSAPTQIAYVPTGSGFMKVTGGVQMSSAATPSLTSDVSGTLPIGNGGTGQTSFASGILHSNGSALSSSAVALGSDVSGQLPAANGGTGLSSLGSGVATFLGTPSGANLASALTTSLPISKGGTGQTSFALGVIKSNGSSLSSTTVDAANDVTGILPTLNGGTGTASLASGMTSFWTGGTSAALAGALSDETGTSLVVFNTSPTIVTPQIASVKSDGTHTQTFPTTTGTIALTTDIPTVAVGLTNQVFGLRLTVSTGVCVPTSDVVDATTIYLTPCESGSFATYDSSVWTVHTISSDASLALSSLTANKGYDVFLSWSSGAVISLSSAWSSDTARTDALAWQDGRQVLSSDHSKLWVGAIYTTATTKTQDTTFQRYVWNLKNQRPRVLQNPLETADSWVRTSSTIRQANGNASNQTEHFTGDASTKVTMTLVGLLASTGSTQTDTAVLIGVDSTTANGGQYPGYCTIGVSANFWHQCTAHYSGSPGLGRHKLVWLEMGGTSAQFGGDLNGPTVVQAGMIGEIWN